jgi:hypothetical protein
MMVVAALIVFPKLALGLSGFETGVAVMPLVKGEPGDDPARPAGRIRNTKKLLRTAALVMSVMLLGSSVVTTLLVPAEAMQKGGPASGRALSYLAHEHLGEIFGTIYDMSTIAILWFAGRRRWRGCSTWCRATCRATAWRRNGRRRRGRWSCCSPRSPSSSPSCSTPTSRHREARTRPACWC